MDWETYIARFEKIDRADIPAFTNEREMEQAIHLYNKSVDHISRDSADIALISLRRLSADYPRFGLAALLAAGLLAYDEDYNEATTLLEQAVEKGQLSDDWQEHAQHCRELIQQDLHLASAPEAPHEPKISRTKSVLNTAAVLEKIKRQNKVKMASDRERQDIIRQGEQADDETFVESQRQPVEYLRLALPVAGALLVLVLLIFAGSRLVSALSERNQQQDQLTWLISRLEVLADDNEAVDGLLQDFDQEFESDSQSQTSTTEQAQTQDSNATDETDSSETTQQAATPTPTPEPTATPAPTATPVPTTDPDMLLMEDAVAAWQEAIALSDTDASGAADQLFIARELLETVPDSKVYEAEGLTAGELYEEVSALLNEIATDAANEYRRTGRALFDAGDYEEALDPYTKAFELDPGNYGGGTAYYAGRSFQELGRYEEAKPYFEYVVENFSGRDIAGHAANRLSQMGF